MAGTGSAGVVALLAPKARGAMQRLAQTRSVGRAVVMGFVGIVFWLILFAMVYRLLLYFRGAEGIGELLAVKLLGLILLGLFSLAFISNIITALSSFFLARDLELLAAAPLDEIRLYGARLLETLLHSSWMVALILAPILAAYGWAYGGGLLFVGVSLLAIAAFLVLPGVVGSAFTLLLVNIFPARRARDLLALIALFAGAALVVLVRLLRPEQLARPEGFRSLVDFVATLQTPSSVWLPSEWAAESITAALGVGQSAGDFFPLLLLCSTAAAVVVFGAMLHGRLYRMGFSRAQEGAELREGGGTRRRSRLTDLALARTGTDVRALVAKDVRTFLRDTTQWSQLILLAGLVVVYVYNIKVLPLWSGEEVGFFLVNVISFLNLALAGFVLAAIAARFLFPAISLEGRTLWLLRHAPLDLRKLVWTKFWVGLVPLLVLALALTVGTNMILRVSPLMMALSVATIVAITFAVSAMALAFGAVFPRFDTDNAAQIPTGFGGLLFMMTSVAYLGAVVALEAWPVYAYLHARARGLPVGAAEVGSVALGLGLAFGLSVVATVLPLRVAVGRVGRLES